MSRIIIDDVALAGDLASEHLEKDWNKEVWGSLYDESNKNYSENAKLVHGIYYRHYLKIVERNELSGQIR